MSPGCCAGSGPMSPPDDGPGGLLIFGTGAQTKYVLETCAASGRRVAAVIGDLGGDATRTAEWQGWTAAYGVPLLGPEAAVGLAAAPDGPRRYLACHAAAAGRATLAAAAEALGLLPAAAAVHPAAVVATTAEIGPGGIVNPGAVIEPFARIGVRAMIHAGAVVCHDSRLGDGVAVSPGARLCGWVRLGDGAVVYAGATVLPRVRIGAGATVGAGAVVISDVPDGTTVVGVPARRPAAPEAGVGPAGGLD